MPGTGEHCRRPLWFAHPPTRDLAPAAVYDFIYEGRETCNCRGQVKAGAKTRTVQVKIDPEHLRNFGLLPPNTYKWRRCYNLKVSDNRASVISNRFERCRYAAPGGYGESAGDFRFG